MTMYKYPKRTRQLCHSKYGLQAQSGGMSKLVLSPEYVKLRQDRCIAVNAVKPRVARTDYATAEYILACINWRSDHSIENGSDRVNLVARRTDQRFLGTIPHGQSPQYHLT